LIKFEKASFVASIFGTSRPFFKHESLKYYTKHPWIIAVLPGGAILFDDEAVGTWE